jgi:hypothetical protein
MAGALAGYFLLAPPLSFVVIGLCLAFAAWTLVATDNSGRIILRLCGVSWSAGRFRSRLAHHRAHRLGKDAMRNQRHHISDLPERQDWGGVCLDQKKLYWKTL